MSLTILVMNIFYYFAAKIYCGYFLELPSWLFYFMSYYHIYRIWPNNHTVHLSFSKLLRKLVKYISIYTKDTLKKRSAKDLPNESYRMVLRGFVVFFFCFCFFWFFFIKAYVVGTHLNYIHKSMQFKWVPTTYSFIKE